MVNKYEWLVQVRDARTKTSDPSIQAALAIGCTIYVTSKFDDTWLSFYYMFDEGEVQVLKGKGNIGIGRDFMLWDRAVKDLAMYEANTEGGNVEVKG